MTLKKIGIIGNTPAASVCSIYLKTANLSCEIIRIESLIKYKVTNVAGVYDIQDFNENTFLQAKNLGVTIIEKQITNIIYNNMIYEIEFFDNQKKIFDILIFEFNYLNLLKTDNLFFMIDNRSKIYEGIELASIGCKTAFEIKDTL